MYVFHLYLFFHYFWVMGALLCLGCQPFIAFTLFFDAVTGCVRSNETVVIDNKALLAVRVHSPLGSCKQRHTVAKVLDYTCSQRRLRMALWFSHTSIEPHYTVVSAVIEPLSVKDAMLIRRVASQLKVSCFANCSRPAQCCRSTC